MSSERTKLKERIMAKLIEAKSGSIQSIQELKDPAIFETLISDDEPILNTVEKKEIPTYDSRRYLFNGKKYYYLNNDTLARDFSQTLRENKESEPFHIRLCLFRLNHECKEPFLQLFVELEDTGTDKNIIFPGFEIDANEFVTNELDDSDENKDQTIFETNCFNKFQEITGIPPDIAKQAYRGYIVEYDNTIYPLFDCTYIDFIMNKNQIWGILDELINEQHVHDYIIDRNIFMMFTHNEFLTDIKDDLNEPINLPCCLYLVKRTEDGVDYENVFLNEDEDEVTTIVNPKLDHETFGLHYYFTTDPIDPENSKKLRRFSAFIDNSLYFLNVSTPITDIDLEGDAEEAEEDETIKTYRDYTSIYFFENYKQLWCIKDTARFTEI
jgi:hypothetical protein